MDPKEVFMEEHERLVSEYMDAHPEADERKVYDALADKAMTAMQDRFADAADMARMRAKEEG